MDPEFLGTWAQWRESTKRYYDEHTHACIQCGSTCRPISKINWDGLCGQCDRANAKAALQAQEEAEELAAKTGLIQIVLDLELLQSTA